MNSYSPSSLLFLLIVTLCGCNGKKSPGANHAEQHISPVSTRQDSVNQIENSIFPIYIDKDKDYEEKKFTLLQDIGKVEYIKLETNDSCLLRESYKLIRVQLTENDIFLSTGDNVLRFDRNGKFINTIGKRGQGPWEVASLFDFVIDETKQEVHLWDATTQHLKTYYFNGGPKKKSFHKAYGSNIGAVRDSSIIYTNFLECNYPMAFLSSLNDGKTLKQILPVRTDKDATGLWVRFSDKFTNNLQYNNKVIYQNFINDTIYTIDINNLSASPRYIQLPPNTGFDGNNSSPFIAFETDRYAYILINKKPPLNHNFVVDKRDNKIYKGFVVDKNLGITSTPIGTNKDNVIIDLYDTYKLLDRLSNNKLRGSLKEIAETLGDEDNPVLMIATLDF